MIFGFNGQWKFLSNFYITVVVYNNIVYSSAEAAFQAQKDPSRAQEFINLSPKQAKALGRKVTLRPDWEAIKCEIMLDVLRAKFQDHCLRAQLVATAPKQLVEANSWGDRFWGVSRGTGFNVLGILLMKVRDEITKKIS